jgi:hypothetical protein
MTPRRRRNRSRSKTLGSVVPAAVYELAQKQAEEEGMTVSNLGASLWCKYLRKMGTTIQL